MTNPNIVRNKREQSIPGPRGAAPSQHGKPDRRSVLLIAQSPTTFSGFFGLGIRFLVDSQGAVRHLAEMHVSGDYRFTRLP